MPIAFVLIKKLTFVGQSDRHFLLIAIFLTSNIHINLFDRTALRVGYRLSEE